MPETDARLKPEKSCVQCRRGLPHTEHGGTMWDFQWTFYDESDPWTLPRLALYVDEIRRARDAIAGDIRLRDGIIRSAAAAGAPQSELARITGLSRAQVQRICDYSKDGGNR